MIQTAIRPFTDAEREEVERQLLDFVSEPVYHGLPHPLWGAFGGFVVGAILSMVAMLVFDASDLWGAVLLITSVMAGFALAWHSHRESETVFRNNRRHYAARLARRLQRGEMEEMTVTASGVVRVVDNYDEVNACFFDVGDNRVLYMREDSLWNAAEDAGPDARHGETFLPSAFRLTRYPDAADEIVHLEPLGPPLTPLRTLCVSGLEEEYYELSNLDVLEGVSLATLEKDLPFLSPNGPGG